MLKLLNKIWTFYIEGFRDMPNYGKRVWTIIIIKLIIMFAILKVFFFQDFLSSKGKTDKEKSEYVSKQLITIKK
ncbi:MAG: DUF4492 domain-containing protein [Bacteroidales bacterium]|nr:DUF4492 domain-containing protein [Bacteroidales bacterium]